MRKRKAPFYPPPSIPTTRLSSSQAAKGGKIKLIPLDGGGPGAGVKKDGGDQRPSFGL